MKKAKPAKAKKTTKPKKAAEDPRLKSTTITGRINKKALSLLAKHPRGIRWTDLKKMIEKSDPSFHPKTVNGCVWKLVETFPDKVHKPEKGLFQLRKS